MFGREHGDSTVEQGRKGVWSRDGLRVYFAGAGLRSQEILSVRIDGTGEQLLADLTGRRGELGDIASDGQTLYFTWEEGLGDIWVMDVLPPRR